MPGIIVREGEHIEQALRRFKKQCEKEGILTELRKREFYEKPSIRLKKKQIQARKRAARKERDFSSPGREAGGFNNRGRS